jgi:hypothetical protein
MLGLIAAASVLQALLLLGFTVGGFILYRRLSKTATDLTAKLADLEARQLAPLSERVDAILVDVKAITARVNHRAERVDDAIAGTIERVDETAERVKHSIWDRVDHVAGVVRGVRAAIVSVLTSDSRDEPPAPAAGRV